jgi:hypothetical protein
MSETAYNSSTAFAIRAIRAETLREAADAIESVWEGIEETDQQFTPAHAAGVLRARAANIEAGKKP